MSRQLTETEVKISLARVANLPPDDVTGYVLVLFDDQDLIKTVTNAIEPAVAISVLARAIEYASAQVQEDAAQ